MEIIEELLQPGNSVQVEFIDANGTKQIFETYVIKNAKKNLLSLLMAQKNENLGYLKSGSNIYLTCKHFRDKHEYVFNTEVLNIKTFNLPVLDVTKPYKIYSSSRRRHFRFEVNLPFSYFYNKKELTGRVINLSSGGLLASIPPNDQLVTGRIIICQIVLPTIDKPVMLAGQITRIQKGENYQGIGLRFPYITKEMQKQISIYLYERQQNSNLQNHQLEFDQIAMA